MAHQIVWFDLPVLELDRAIKFYTAVLNVKIEREAHGPIAVGVFPHGGDDVSGCLHQVEGEKPSAHGALIYFNVQGRLDDAIAQAEKNGGKILKPKHQIGPWGSRAVVLDTEGNRVALHSK